MPRPVIDRTQRQKLGQTIREYRHALGIDQAEAARRIGIAKSSYSNWELGIARPDLETVPRLCEVLQIPVHELLNMNPQLSLNPRDRKLLKVYHALSEESQKAIDAHLAQLYRQEHAAPAFRVTTLMEESAAAGFGAPMDGASAGTHVYVRSNPATNRGAVIIKVNGHSMEPEYLDGSMVYVSTRDEVHYGDLGIFVYEGTSYFKLLDRKGLVSLNPDYPLIPVTNPEAFRTVGKVLGRVGDFDLLTGDELRQAMACCASKGGKNHDVL